MCACASASMCRLVTVGGFLLYGIGPSYMRSFLDMFVCELMYTAGASSSKLACTCNHAYLPLELQGRFACLPDALQPSRQVAAYCQL